MRRLTLILTIICTAFVTVAQTYTGKVKNTKGKPVPFANVMFYSLPDSTFVDGVITNDSGNFSLKNTQKMKGFLRISFIGYKTADAAAIPMQTITLKPDAVAIREVTVKASRPIAKMTADGLQTTVANTVLSHMGTGNDVLKRIPLVSGDNGSFKVFGRGKAAIYINHRMVRDASELDNLNSKDIQNIEVISNPGARYDASVPAVIRIKTIRKRGDGFSFNIRSSFSAGRDQDYTNYITANYRKKGLDLFAGVYHFDVTSFHKGDVLQTVSIDTLWHQKNYIDGIYRSNGLNASFGANYEFNKNHYAGIKYKRKTSPREKKDTRYFTSEIYADNLLFDKWDNYQTNYNKTTPSSQVNLYYTGKIKKLAVNFSADYLDSGQTSEGENIENSRKYKDRIINSFSNTNNSLWAAKLQLSYPVWKGRLALGSEYVNIKREDEYINNDIQQFSSQVNIKEKNTALFAEYRFNTKLGKFNIGIRCENASYDYFINNKLDKSKSRSYNQWFPNASFSSKIGNVRYQLAYTSKVIRPSYSQLNNNITYANRFTLQTGSPYLKPTIKHNISLMGVWKIIQASVNYTYNKDAIDMWFYRYKEDPKVSLIRPRNFDHISAFSAMVTIAPKFGAYKPQLRTGIQKQWFNLSDYGVDKKFNKPVVLVSLYNIIDLPNNFMASLDASFRSKGNSGIRELYKNQFLMNFSLSKSFFKKSLRAKLSVYDIFDQIRNAYETVMPYTKFKNLYRFDKRKVSLTLRYYFNTAGNKYKGSTAGKDAMKRL